MRDFEKEVLDITVELITSNNLAFPFLARINSNREMALLAVQKCGSNFKYLDPSLKDDREIIIAALERDASMAEFVPKELLEDEEIARVVVRGAGVIEGGLNYLPEAYKNDREFALSAVKTNVCNFPYVAEEFRNDEEFINAILDSKSCVTYPFLEYAGEDILKNKELIKKCVIMDNDNLAYIHALKDNKEFVLEVLEQTINGKGFPSLLQHIGETLRRDKEFVKYMLERQGYGLEHCSDLMEDEELILLSTRGDLGFKPFKEFLSKEENLEILKLVVKNNKKGFDLLPDHLKTRELIMEIANDSFMDVLTLPVEYRRNEEIIRKIASKSLYQLNFVTDLQLKEKLENDSEFLLDAVKTNYHNIEYVKNEKLSQEIIEVALTGNGCLVHVLPKEIRDNPQLGLLAIQSRAAAFNFLSNRLKSNIDFIGLAINTNKKVFSYLDEKFQEIMLKKYVPGNFDDVKDPKVKVHFSKLLIWENWS